MFVDKLPIAKKLLMAFSVVIVAATTADVLVYRSLDTIETTAQQNGRSFDLSLVVDDMLISTVDQQNSVRAFMLSGDEKYVEAYKKGKAEFEQAATTFKAKTVSDEQRQRTAKVQDIVGNWQTKLAERQIALMGDPSTIDAARALTGTVPLDEARSLLDEMIEVQSKLIDARMVSAEAADTSARLTLVVGGVLAALMAVGMGLLLARSIATPVRKMTDVMRRLAAGDKTVEVPSTGRGDEIGAMAEAVLQFKQAAIEQERLEQEASAARDAQSASRDRQAAIDNAKAEDLRVFVHAVEAGFDRLSQGDLTVRMNQAVAPEFEPIRAKFNGSVETLEGTIGSVVSAVGSMRVGLNQITVAAGDLSQRTEQQAASLEETVAALSEVMHGVNDTAGTAMQAQGTAQAVQQTAEKGGAIVAQAVTAMSEIERSSSEIGKIIGVIDEIAFQTNLLALNAGVEAARAGEAGRGFAVVAQEVRGLAQRSAEAAKEIKDLISTSSQQVGQGVELVTASGRSLEEIVSGVGGLAKVVATIAHSAKEQSVSLKEVSTAADQMDKVTQQNAAMVEETTAAAQSLASETEDLARLTERFQARAASGEMSAAPIRRPTTAARSASVAASRPVPQMKHVGRTGAAPQAVPDDWQEF